MVVFSYKGHLLLGFITAFFITSNPISFMTVLLGSLLPDIDHPKSMLGRYNIFVHFMKHRGHAHSIIGILIISTPFLLVNTELINGKNLYVMSVAGALSHLLGDKMSSALKGHKFPLKLW